MGCVQHGQYSGAETLGGAGGAAARALSPASKAVTTSEHSGLGGSITLSGSQSETFEKQQKENYLVCSPYKDYRRKWERKHTLLPLLPSTLRLFA